MTVQQHRPRNPTKTPPLHCTTTTPPPDTSNGQDLDGPTWEKHIGVMIWTNGKRVTSLADVYLYNLMTTSIIACNIIECMVSLISSAKNKCNPLATANATILFTPRPNITSTPILNEIITNYMGKPENQKNSLSPSGVAQGYTPFTQRRDKANKLEQLIAMAKEKGKNNLSPQYYIHMLIDTNINATTKSFP
ncbi:hypothetical protein D9756_010397 [Leucocoprinus leucothites]|uniref:Uncharacterized protein n=1 Tax=Leucocoprinus leucothites TaxID=201217 RepID=A0A8H5CRL3_9AGAR|nr:hypothetical protein D9756_010397 [Leucoagaricus leucothites]